MKRRRDVRWRWWNIATVVAFPFALYAAAAMTVYRFQHPELTETQLLLAFWDAIMWR